MNQREKEEKELDQYYMDLDFKKNKAYEDFNNLLKKIDENRDNPDIFLPLFNDIIRILNEVILYNLDNDKLVIDFYKSVYDICLLIKDRIKNTKNDSYYPLINVVCQYWKSRIYEYTRTTVNKYLDEGNKYFKESKYENALSNYTKANFFCNRYYDDKKSKIELLNKTGLSYFYAENFKESRKKFLEALEIDREYTDTLYNLATVYEREGKEEQAKKFYEKIIKINPDHFDALASLGILLYKKADWNKAKEYLLDRAYKINKEDWRLLLAIGCVFSEGFHKYSTSEKYFQKCSELNPNSLLVQLNRAQNFLLLEEYEKSKNILIHVMRKIKNIEDRSTSIITRILLICSIYLDSNDRNSERGGEGKGDGNNNNYSSRSELVDLISELIQYCSKKDLNLVDWNFKDLKQHIKESDLDSEKKEQIILILSIPEQKTALEKENHLNKIKIILSKLSQFSDSKTIKQIDEKKIRIVKEIKPYENNSDHYEWKVYLDVTSDILSDIESVDYILDPQFVNPVSEKNKKTIINNYNNISDLKFLIKILGYTDCNMEIQINFNDKSIAKLNDKLLIQK